MGFLKSSFTKKAESFTSDPGKTEYDNWLDFAANGGSYEEWQRMKRMNNLLFAEDSTEIFRQYIEEVHPISDSYYSALQKIEKEWSILYNLKDFSGTQAALFEEACKNSIALYKKMKEIDLKYGEKTATNIPALKRLAMLYEKQGNFEKSVDICKQAISFGMDERSRMIRMIKKAGRTPTAEELSIIEKSNL